MSPRPDGPRRALRGWLAGLACLLALSSCASVPERPPAEWLGVLPADSTLFVSLSIPPSAGMLKRALDDAGPDYADVKTLLDMTRRMYVAVSLAPEKAPRYWAVALGSYPSALIGWRLGGNADWKGMSSAMGKWFQSEKRGLQVSLPADSVLLASNGGIEALFPRLRGSPALTLPPEVVKDMEKADLVVYIPELPGTVAGSDSGSIRMPIHEVWLDARRGGSSYVVGGTVNLTSEKEARLLTLVLKIGLVAWMRSQNLADAGERLKAVSIAPSGTQVILSGLSFTDDEIVPAFLSLIGVAPAGNAEPTAGNAEAAAGGEARPQ
jgi:hypothetical protein